jgi:hypothetical protein
MTRLFQRMKAASTGVLDSLMMKKMNFTILSTIPTGPALARDLISSVRSGPMMYQPERSLIWVICRVEPPACKSLSVVQGRQCRYWKTLTLPGRIQPHGSK